MSIVFLVLLPLSPTKFSKETRRARVNYSPLWKREARGDLIESESKSMHRREHEHTEIRFCFERSAANVFGELKSNY